MEEYIYREEDFISSKSLKQLNDVMAQHDFMPDEIKGKVAFQRVFKYYVLTVILQKEWRKTTTNKQKTNYKLFM